MNPEFGLTYSVYLASELAIDHLQVRSRLSLAAEQRESRVEKGAGLTYGRRNGHDEWRNLLRSLKTSATEQSREGLGRAGM